MTKIEERFEELRLVTEKAAPRAHLVARVALRVERRRLVRQASLALTAAALVTVTGLGLLRRSHSRLAQAVLASVDLDEGGYP